MISNKAFGMKNFIDPDDSIVGGWTERIAIRAAVEHRTKTAMVLCQSPGAPLRTGLQILPALIPPVRVTSQRPPSRRRSSHAPWRINEDVGLSNYGR